MFFCPPPPPSLSLCVTVLPLLTGTDGDGDSSNAEERSDEAVQVDCITYNIKPVNNWLWHSFDGAMQIRVHVHVSV